MDYLTKFAVIVQEKAQEQAPETALTDISGHWAGKNITELAALRVVSGYPDGTFRPDNRITRSEFTVILVKAFLPGMADTTPKIISTLLAIHQRI